MGKVTTVFVTFLLSSVTMCKTRWSAGEEVWVRDLAETNGKLLGKPECWGGGGYTVMNQINLRGE